MRRRTPTRYYGILTALCALLAPPASGQRVGGRAPQDTLLLRAPANGSWGRPQLAVEVLRVGGESSAVDFGAPACLTGLADGGVAVFDQKGPTGPVVRVFDESGSLRFSLGRGGAGPGEIGARPRAFCLAAASDGTLLMLDVSNNRINRWSASGKLLASIPLPLGVGGPPPYILPGPQGTVYVRVAVTRPRPGAGMDFAAYTFVHMGPDGSILDTLPRPHASNQDALPRLFDPREYLLPLSDGRVVTTAIDGFGFLIQGKQRVIRVERPVERVRVLAEEREELEADLAFTTAQTRGMAQNPGIAPFKAPVAYLVVDVDGRIWLQRNVTAVKGETVYPPSLPGQPKPPGLSYLTPPVFDAFRGDGTFLGEVRLPLPQKYLQEVAIAGTAIWGIQIDSAGVPLLVKWRIASGKGRE